MGSHRSGVTTTGVSVIAADASAVVSGLAVSRPDTARTGSPSDCRRSTPAIAPSASWAAKSTASTRSANARSASSREVSAWKMPSATSTTTTSGPSRESWSTTAIHSSRTRSAASR